MPIRLLYLDTSADETIVSWMEDGQVVAEEIIPGGRDHGIHIHGMIDRVIHQAGHPLAALSGVVVMNGPGSYTGLRIALSVAKGICYTLQTSLFLLNKLDVMALASMAIQPKGERIVLARARANEFFYGLYNELGEAIEAPKVVELSHWQHQNCPIFTFQLPLIDEMPQLKPVSISAAIRCLASFSAYSAKKNADLMLSEPFYLKNVFINKINKL